MTNSTRAEIDLSALTHNIGEIRRLCGDRALMAVVKANAYGHGDRLICAKLFRLGVKNYAVYTVGEALAIRDTVPGCDILVFGFTDEALMRHISENDFIQTIPSLDYARRLNGFASESGKKIRCHVKINSGMNCAGIDAAEELRVITSLPMLNCEGLYTHFASADSLDGDDEAFTDKQAREFAGLASLYNLKTHCQNSGGLLYHNYKADYARAGIIMYGLRPNTAVEAPFTLQPVMRVKSFVAQLREVPAGSFVSYCRTYKTDGKRLLAVVPIGYADGYSRLLSNKGKMLINGALAPVCGRVCMDQTIIDVTGIGGVDVGTEAGVYTETDFETSVEHTADLLGTIPYEITCSVGNRVERVIVNG